MKTAEFLEKLSKTPRTWRLVDWCGRSHIRNKKDYCPIEAVGRRKGAFSLGYAMGLRTDLVDRIVDGADLPKHTLWRKRLLRACGLE